MKKVWIFLCFFAAGAAVLAGAFLLNGQRYYLSACLILLLAFAAMLLRLERRHVRAREMVILAIMTALAVTGTRGLFSAAAGQALRRSHHSRRSIARRGARLSDWSDDRLCLKLFLWTGPVDALSNVRFWTDRPSGRPYF